MFMAISSSLDDYSFFRSRLCNFPASDGPIEITTLKGPAISPRKVLIIGVQIPGHANPLALGIKTLHGLSHGVSIWGDRSDICGGYLPISFSMPSTLKPSMALSEIEFRGF